MISFILKIPHALAMKEIFLVLFSNVFSSDSDESGIAIDNFILKLDIYFIKNLFLL